MVVGRTSTDSNNVGQSYASNVHQQRRRDTLGRLARLGTIEKKELTAARDLERCIVNVERGSLARHDYQTRVLARRGHINRGTDCGRAIQLEQSRLLQGWVERLKRERLGRESIQVTMGVILGRSLAELDRHYGRRRAGRGYA